MKRAIIHAGFHKTGTTAAQHFFQAHADRFAAEGIAVYRGRHLAFNHAELHAVTMRDDRDSPFKANGVVTIDDEYRRAVAADVAAFSAAHPDATLLFSSEGVSLLRYQDEFARLSALIPGRMLSFIFCRREREAWRVSYRAQHERFLSADPPRDHFTYLEDDSWLLDFDARLGAFRTAFGPEAVQVIDYDEAVRRDGTIIPALLRALGVEQAFADVDLTKFFVDPRP